MSATPPFGPAYDQPPDDGNGQGSNQWRPQAGGPRAAQGGPGQAPGGHGQDPNGGQVPPGGIRPEPGRPAGGYQQRPAAGGRPQAGGPQAGRGQARPQPGPYPSPQPGQYQSPQTGQYPSPHTGGIPQPTSPPRPQQASQSPGQVPPPPDPAGEDRSPEPFEEAAFADDPSASWGGGEGTTAIGKLGYVPKETRRRSDFQKKRSRARKSSPIPKILAVLVVLGLVGGAGWWWFNRDDSGDQTSETASTLTYGNSEEPCSLVDAAPLEDYIDGVEPESAASSEQKRRGWEQTCMQTYGAPDSAVALLEIEAISFETDAKAGVNFDLGSREISDMTDSWTVVDPAPEVGEQSAAVASVVDEGTSNYQLHVQDANAYVVARVSLVDSGLDQEGLTTLAVELTDLYLTAWRDAS